MWLGILLWVLAAPALAASLPTALKELRAVARQPLMDSWRIHAGPVDGAQLPDFDDRGWSVAKPDTKGAIGWEGGGKTLWLRQWVSVPADWHGYPSTATQVRLNLIWWAAGAEIYVDGRFVQSGDLYDAVQRVVLSRSVQPGQRFLVALKLISPGHDRGALSQARLDVEAAPGRTDPAMVADELEVVDGYLREIATPQEKKRFVPVLARAIAQIDFKPLSSGQVERFERSLQSARTTLTPVAALTRKRTIALVGHSHIDMAWLWPVPETRQVIEKTFRSVLGLQADFPQLLFAQSTAQSYQWLEQEQPRLFEQIQQQVRAGRWELVGGMWVEPDLNLPDGESLVRQVFYGKRYFLSRFGREVRVGWNPDSFGYTWQLPQIYKKAGIDYFLTQKLEWNDTTKFPHRTFWWQAPDGSKILAYMSPPLGEQIDAVKMAKTARAYEKNTGYPKLMWLYGVGDHGGGPTRDMLETEQRWEGSKVYPKLVPTTARQFLGELESADRDYRFPTWKDELYLEFHRGTFTTHADQKRHNRRSEVLLGNLERFSAADSLLQDTGYPGPEIEKLWKTLLFNQFHDILPGSAIPAVYTQANQEWEALQATGGQMLDATLHRLASQVNTAGEGIPVVVFNGRAGMRSAVVRVRVANLPSGSLSAFDRTGNATPVQRTVEDPDTIVFWAKGVPGVGQKVFWLRRATNQPSSLVKGLENNFVRVRFDERTGNLSSVFDKQAGRETLSGPGNQLQLFKDQGQYWDAWNIDPKYTSHPLAAPILVSLTVLEQGPVRSVVRVVRRFGQSTFSQDLILYRDSPVLYIDNQIDWRERHVLLKAAFPLRTRSNQATYEIPFATIERSTRRDTARRRAQWEVPALRWASVSDGRSGASLLNDSKYGYDARLVKNGTLLRLSLLRGSEWPDPTADMGEHRFTYAFYPHQGDWRSAGAVQQGLDLNAPLMAVPEPAHAGPLPETLLGIDNPQVVLTSWKQAEDGNGWVLRLYESQGRRARTTVTLPRPVLRAQKTDLLERAETGLPFTSNRLTLTLGPYEIQTVRVEVGAQQAAGTKLAVREQF